MSLSAVSLMFHTGKGAGGGKGRGNGPPKSTDDLDMEMDSCKLPFASNHVNN